MSWKSEACASWPRSRYRSSGKRFEIEKGFEADLIVEDVVIVELKSLEQLARVHKKQLLTYLRLTNCRLGLVINFGAEMIGDGIARIATAFHRRTKRRSRKQRESESKRISRKAAKPQRRETQTRERIESKRVSRRAAKQRRRHRAEGIVIEESHAKPQSRKEEGRKRPMQLSRMV